MDCTDSWPRKGCTDCRDFSRHGPHWIFGIRAMPSARQCQHPKSGREPPQYAPNVRRVASFQSPQWYLADRVGSLAFHPRWVVLEIHSPNGLASMDSSLDTGGHVTGLKKIHEQKPEEKISNDPKPSASSPNRNRHQRKGDAGSMAPHHGKASCHEPLSDGGPWFFCEFFYKLAIIGPLKITCCSKPSANQNHRESRPEERGEG